MGVIDLRSNTDCGTPVTASGNGFFVTSDAVNLSGYDLVGQGDLRELSIGVVKRDLLKTKFGVASVDGTTLMDCLWDMLTLKADPTGQARCKPLIPTTQEVLEIHLGGHSIVRTRRFDLSMPEAANVLAVLREDYREVRALALDGKLGTAVNGSFVPDPQFHRRYLDQLGKKFRVKNPEDFFIPSDLPKEKRLSHGTTITDNFNRANADALGTSSEGWSWTEVQNDIDIVSNQAATTAGGFYSARAETDLSSADQYAEVTAVDAGVQAHVAAAPRFAAAATTYYRGGYYSGSTALFVSKIVAGTETNINSAGVTPSLPELYRCEINGSTLKGYQAGVERVSATDTAITGNTRSGFAGWGNNTITCDNFTASDLAAATGQPTSKRFGGIPGMAFTQGVW